MIASGTVATESIDLEQLAESAIGVAESVTGDIHAEAVRSLLNVVGTSIGASRTPEVDLLVAGAAYAGGPGDVPLPGRGETLDPVSAALVTAYAAHLDDFDDTHLATVVHPAASLLGAALATSWRSDCTGEELVRAVAVGIELQLRVAVAMSPSHYDAGWHITGTVGPLGAATTVGILHGLDPRQLAHAIAIASSMTLGHREGFGTMTKAFHPGKAASNGLVAAGLARRGFTGSATALDGARGYFRVLAPTVDPALLTDGWGERWELLSNTYKPYPCGIVSHPAIEAAEVLHTRLAGRAVAGVDVSCHPLVAELTGNPDPRDGLQARFSTIHGVAAGLQLGRVDLAAYADDVVCSPELTRMRGLVTLVPSDQVARAAVVLRARLADGSEVTESVDHALGSIERPLTDEQLDTKVAALVGRAMPGREQSVIEATRDLASATSVRAWIQTISGGR